MRTLSEKSSSDTGAIAFCFRGGGFRGSALSASEGTRLLFVLGPSLEAVKAVAGEPGLRPRRAGGFAGAVEASELFGVLAPDWPGLSCWSVGWSTDSAGLDEDPSFARRRRRIWDKESVISYQQRSWSWSLEPQT